MNPETIEWIGGVGAILTTSAFIPQVYKTGKTKSTESISLPMLLLTVTGIGFWLCYGLLIESISLILGNLVTFVNAALLIFFKLRYK